MVYRQAEWDRTRVCLDDSAPLLAIGLGAGFAVGWGLRRLSGVWPPVSRVLAPVLVAVLGGSIAGPLGWLARDHRLDWSGAEAIRHATAWGAGVGLALFAVGRVASALGGTGQSTEPSAVADPARDIASPDS
jgi:hypothetical protein